MSPFIPNPKIIVGSLALLVLGHVSHYHAEAMSTNTGTPRSRTGNGTPRTSNTKNQKPTYYNYFAFGSNMASSTMTALRSLDPVASTAAILPNHRLAFNVPGTAFVEPSWASVEPLKEKDTNTNTNTDMNANDEKYVDNNDGNRNYRNGKNNLHGVLYKLTEKDFESVCSTEGVPFGYTLHRCRVVPYRGDGAVAGETAMMQFQQEQNDQEREQQKQRDQQQQQNGDDADIVRNTKINGIFAYTLRAARKEWREAKDTPPSQSYLNVLIRGAEEYQLDREYLDYLKGIDAGKTLVGDGIAEAMLEAAERRQRVV